MRGFKIASMKSVVAFPPEIIYRGLPSQDREVDFVLASGLRQERVSCIVPRRGDGVDAKPHGEVSPNLSRV